jgi:hypothetical protein
MKITILKIIAPPLLGIFVVLSILTSMRFIIYDGFVWAEGDIKFLKYFLPFSIVASIIIQFVLTLPFWTKFKTHKKVWGLSIIPFTVIISIVAGLAFGLVFWDKSFGIVDLIAASLTGILAFGIYWTCNLLALRRIDKPKIF